MCPSIMIGGRAAEFIKKAHCGGTSCASPSMSITTSFRTFSGVRRTRATIPFGGLGAAAHGQKRRRSPIWMMPEPTIAITSIRHARVHMGDDKTGARFLPGRCNEFSAKLIQGATRSLWWLRGFAASRMSTASLRGTGTCARCPKARRCCALLQTPRGVYLGDKEHARPLFAELERRKAVVFPASDGCRRTRAPTASVCLTR